MTRMFSFILLLAVILAVGFFFIRVMAIFAISLFLALVLVVLFLPLHRWMVARLPHRPRVAAIFTTATVMFVVLLPLSALLSLAAVEGSHLLKNLSEGGIRERVDALRTSLSLRMPMAEEMRFIESSLNSLASEAAGGATAVGNPRAMKNIEWAVEDLQQKLAAEGLPVQPSMNRVQDSIAAAQASVPGTLAYQRAIHGAARTFDDFKNELLGGPYRAWLTELVNPSETEISLATNRAVSIVPRWLSTVGGATTALAAEVVLGLLVMIIAIYFFLVDGPHMLQYIMELSPIEDHYERQIWAEFDRLSRAVVAATLVSAVVQGFLAGIGYWLSGLENLFLLTVLTGFMAMIPFVGTFVIWFPATLWLAFHENRIGAAIFLGLYGLTVVSTIDNFIKPYILHGQSNLHPLVALLSVLGGVQALGPLGIIVGPMLAAFLQVLLNVLHQELKIMDRPRVPNNAKTVNL